MVTKSMGEHDSIVADLVQVVRLALSDQAGDVRLYVARLVRKYRSLEPDLAGQLDSFLRLQPSRASRPLRGSSPMQHGQMPIPVDDESRLTLLKSYFDTPGQEIPLLAPILKEQLDRLVLERNRIKQLEKLGLSPTRSAVFVGKPGVGKTLTARWLAGRLGVPLYVLDLTAVMSSFLGKSGGNIRAALDFAKRQPCVLLLDELDAIAKRRSDETDIGELKRLVTVIMQEVEDWPATGLLLAATNHPELIDPALWRRFDLIVKFEMPLSDAIAGAVRRFLGPDYGQFENWHDLLVVAFEGESFSDIERDLQRFRRSLALGTSSAEELAIGLVIDKCQEFSRQNRIQVAVKLARVSSLSQRAIAAITGVSKDTIRKYLGNDKIEKGV